MAPQLTYEDYVRLPSDRRWEVIGGAAYAVPSPSADHQRIAFLIGRRIAEHLDAYGGGEIFVAPLDVVLDDDEIVQPDLIFVAADDTATVGRDVRGAPAWVIEVVSDAVRDKLVKRDLYLRFGVREYWAVDLDLRIVEIYRPDEAPRVVDASGRAVARTLPGFEIEVAEIFRDLR